MAARLNLQRFSLGAHAPAFEKALQAWDDADGVRRLWAKDPALWTGGDESRWLGWLDIVVKELSRVGDLEALGCEVVESGFRKAVVLGMGGSSLCADVLRRSLGSRSGHPELHVLDSTVPAQIAELEARLDLDRTLFLVASKSGSTAEPDALERYWFDKIASGERFLAVTDPGSALEQQAREKGYRRVLFGEPTIGGRFSALSPFGLGPASILGIDLRSFLERAKLMTEACGPEVKARENPGVALGIALGVLALEGRDKLTLVTSPEIESLGGWLEQLLAESTGKNGKGIVPVDREALGTPGSYGDDRLFVQIGPGAPDPLHALEAAGHPVVRIELDAPEDVAQEFFRWEIATAVAGSILGLNPFDQPDVEASKVATRALAQRFEETGELPEEEPLWEEDGLKLFTDERNREPLGAGGAASVSEVLRAHLARLSAGDYFAMNAFVAMNVENDRELQALRLAVREKRRVATTVGYGPRYLHSTGQLHKGGPNRGVFLQITSDDAVDLAIPGRRYTFGQMKTFQAAGDFQVLLERGRRCLRVHLGKDVPAGLRDLRRLLGAEPWDSSLPASQG